MTKSDDAVEQAYNKLIEGRFYPKPHDDYERGLNAGWKGGHKSGYRVGYLAGAASIDRVAVVKPNSVYVASRASIPERGAMWRKFRDDGYRITSSWIDEDGEGATDDFGDLWTRITREVSDATAVILYAEQGDFPLKGAYIEVGIALGQNKPVIVCLPNVSLEPRSCRPIGSWISHPLVTRIDDIQEAMDAVVVSLKRRLEKGK